MIYASLKKFQYQVRIANKVPIAEKVWTVSRENVYKICVHLNNVRNMRSARVEYASKSMITFVAKLNKKYWDIIALFNDLMLKNAKINPFKSFVELATTSKSTITPKGVWPAHSGLSNTTILNPVSLFPGTISSVEGLSKSVLKGSAS